MREFLEKLTLAIAPLVVGHVLDVRKEVVKAREVRTVYAEADADSFAAYVKARRS